MRKMQHQTTGQFDKMKNGCALAEFQELFKIASSPVFLGGMYIAHLAAAYN
jgi:hypothetical protein